MLSFGKIAKVCSSSNDRSKECGRCEAEGHIRKDCGANLNYTICKGKEGMDNRHIAVSGRCPEYRGVFSVKRKWAWFKSTWTLAENRRRISTPEWTSRTTNMRGLLLLEAFAELDVVLVYVGTSCTFRGRGLGSIVDRIFIRDHLCFLTIKKAEGELRPQFARTKYIH